MRGSGRRCLPWKERSAQRPRDQDLVARPRPRAHDGPLRGGLAQEGHAHHQRSVPGVGVAADQVDLEPIGHPFEPGVQALGHGNAAGSRQGHADDGGPRQPRHRGDVGEVHPHRLVADGLGAVGLEPEMAAVQEHVGRDQKLCSRSDVEDGAVVADPQNRALPGPARMPADPVDQGESPREDCGRRGPLSSPDMNGSQRCVESIADLVGLNQIRQRRE